MPDTLKLYLSRGSLTPVLDLSSYVDVGSGGINPGDDPVQSAVWADAAVGYGSHLIGVSEQNRPFAAALLISAASIDAVSSLERAIRQFLSGPSPVIEWRREAATASTFYIVRHGRLIGDARYNQRLEGQTSSARRLLAATCAPYGMGAFPNQYPLQTAAPVSAAPPQGGSSYNASGYAGSNPVTAAFPSIGGDAPVSWALTLRATIAASAPSAALSYQSAMMWMALGRAATASDYFPLKAATPGGAAFNLAPVDIGAGIGGGAIAALLTDPWAPGGGKAAQLTGTRMTASGPWSGASPAYMGVGAVNVPDGLYRAFVAARYRQHASFTTASSGLLRLWWDYQPGPAIELVSNSPSTWRWYDAGDVVVQGNNSIPFLEAAYPSGATHAASPHFNVSGIALIPKDFGYTFVRPLPANNQGGISISGDQEDGGLAIYGAFDNGQMVGGPLNQPGLADVIGDAPRTLPAASGAPATSYLVALAQVGMEPNVGQGVLQTMHDRVVPFVLLSAFDRYTFAK